MSLHFAKGKKTNGLKGKGFYIALGICLVAIGVAAWTTYDSVMNFLGTDQTESTVSGANSKVAPAGQTVSGVTAGVPSQAGTESTASKAGAAVTSSKAQSSSSKTASTPAKAAQTTPQKEPLFMYPVGKTVTKAFSGSNPVYSLTLNDWRTHTGVDLAADQGQVVQSISDGTVKDIYTDPMWGPTLVVSYTGGYEAYYCGLGETALVKKGDKVEIGKNIGSVGTVPAEIAEAPHLHLGIKKDGKWMDPVPVLENKNK